MNLPPCGSNPALKAISDAKNAINNQLTAGKSAITSLNAQMTALKAKVLAAVPKIPTLDSFQAELAGLVGASPTKIAAFVAKWKGKVEGLDELVAKVTGGISGISSLDFCKDVPNAKMDPVTKEVKVQPAESTPPTESPSPSQTISPTVVDNSKKISTGQSGVIVSDVESRMNINVYSAYKAQVRKPMKAKLVEWAEEWKILEKDKNYKALIRKLKKTGKNVAELRDSGQLSAEELAVAMRTRALMDKYDNLVKYEATLDFYFEHLISVEAAGTNDNNKAINAYRKGLQEDKGIDKLGIRSYFTTAESIASSNSALIKEWYAYFQNKPKD